jgi:hypothetical protein
MGGHEAEKPVQLQHRPLRRSGEDAGKGTGSREDPTIHTPPIVEQIADGNLELLLLGGCGGWGCPTDAGKRNAGEAKEGETKRDGDAEKKEERRLVGERKIGEGKKVGEDENRKLGEDEK